MIRILFVDFKKAFDLIDHNIILDKLRQLDLPQFLIKWYHSFLKDRKSRVKIANLKSSEHPVQAGVPQGTLLGPTLFLLHIKCLQTCCPSTKFVDDTTIWEQCNIDGSDSKLQTATQQLADWSNSNNMSLNHKKTKEMIIYMGRKPLSLNAVSLGDDKVDRISQYKLLGVILNDRLSWNDHVDFITKKAGKRLYFLTLLKRSGISETDIVQVYTSTIRSLLEYACEIWGPSLPSYLSDRIEHIQFRALKIIYSGLSYRAALEKSNLCTLKSRRTDMYCKFFNDLSRDDHPLNHLLPRSSCERQLRSNRKFDLPKVKTERLKHSPIYHGLFIS